MFFQWSIYIYKARSINLWTNLSENDETTATTETTSKPKLKRRMCSIQVESGEQILDSSMITIIIIMVELW